MFNCCGYTPEIKLNIEWQMTFLIKKINLDMMDKIVVKLVDLYWVKNFKPCNKYLCLLARHLSPVIKKVPIVELKSRLDSIWQHQSVDSFKQLVIENSDWFVELKLATLFN